MFTVDDIEIQQLEDAESSEEIEPSFGPAVGDRGREEEGGGEGGGGECIWVSGRRMRVEILSVRR